MKARTSTAESAPSGRLLEGPSEELVLSAYRLELRAAPVLLPDLVFADLAHVLYLLEHGLVPAEAGRDLVRALLELRETVGALAGGVDRPSGNSPLELDPVRGDLVMNVESWLRDRVGRAAGYLLVGRPRREAVAVAFHLAARRRLVKLVASLERLQRVLVDLAAVNLDTLAVDYTYWQAAQPTTLAHTLLAWAYPLGRDADRAEAAFRRANASPAGAGCTNGTAIPLDRAAIASALGFDGVVLHTRDANWEPDLAFELTSIAASASLTVERLAEDLQVWGTREFGFVELADRSTRVSLAMPQKKNPYALVFVRGVAARLLGRVSEAGSLAKTATGQPDPRIFAQDDVPDSLDLAEQSAALVAEVVAGLRFDTGRLEDAARRGYLAGNDLAETVMYARKLPFGEAHRIVGAAVRRALEGGGDRSAIDAAALDEAAIEVMGSPLGLSDHEISMALDPVAAVARRTGIGGAAPEAVERLIDERRRALRRQSHWLARRSRAIDAAESALIARAQAAVTG